MSEGTIGIIVLHVCILVLQLLAAKVFSELRFAIFGIYFVLMPIGFGFFMPPGPLMTAILVLGGLTYILIMANRAVKSARREDPEVPTA